MSNHFEANETAQQSPERRANATDTGPYHELCARCKRLAHLLEESFNTGLWFSNVARRHGFDVGVHHDGITCGTNRDLLPDVCHLCAVLNATMNCITAEKENLTYKLSQFAITLSRIDSVVTSQPNPDCILDGTRSFSVRVRITSQYDRYSGNMDELRISSYNVHQQWTKPYLVPKLHNIHPLERVKHWIQDCVFNHEKCNRRPQESISASSRPKRILSLANDKVVLRLSDHIEGSFEYLTLSHMWGAFPEQQLRLVLSSVEKMQVRIHEDEMPEIYRTAIQLTRNLGYRYLWIDSLCIIQDSEKDWESEAAKMAEIYSNGVCNLSFLHPPEVGDGQLWSDPRAYSPCIIRPAGPSENGLIIRPCPSSQVLLRGASVIPYWDWLDSSQWPLFTRAWAFQEQFLCRRTIFYQHHHLAWECAKTFCDETLGQIHRPEKNRNHLYRERLAKIMNEEQMSKLDLNSLPQQDSRNSFTIWADLILEYRARQLTFAKDRVMALAGVARRFSSIHQLTYLAGTYLQHMPHSLLWRTIGAASVKVDSTVLESPSSKVPSWSWFSAPITKVDGFMPAAKYTSKGYKNKLLARMVRYQWAHGPVNTVPASSFYDFRDLSITLRVVSFAAILQMATSSDQPHTIVTADLPECFHTFEPDAMIADEVLEESTVAVRLAVLRTSGDKSVEGLLLIPGSRHGTWKRLGYWAALLFSKEVAVRDAAAYLDDDVVRRLGHCEKQELILV